jgi:sulfur carrier protein
LIWVNGQPSGVTEGSTVLDALRELGLEADARGVAVAVDGEVVPRGRWGAQALAAGARVEVLTAMQGG